MKYLIASDIHGSSYYCELLLEAFAKEQPDKLVLLGDILYHGPRNDLPKEYNPKAVIEMLNPMKDCILCVRGNCDGEVDQMVLQFPILADYAVLCAGDRMIYATHGHHFNPGHMPPLKAGDILLNGHTHIPACEKIGGCWYMNPGSVSIPKEGSKHGYILLQENQWQWKMLNGQVYMQWNPAAEEKR